MFTLSFRLAATIHRDLAFYMPTNRAVTWLRGPGHVIRTILLAFGATTVYIFAMRGCVLAIEHGVPGFLNVLVMLFAWNALKFAVVGLFAPLSFIRISMRRVRS